VVTVWRGDSAAPLAVPVSTVPVGARPIALSSGDLNGDAIPDVAVVANGADVVDVFFGIGDATFTAPTILPVGPLPSSAVV